MKPLFEREDNYRSPEPPIDPGQARDPGAGLASSRQRHHLLATPAVEVDLDPRFQHEFFWIHFNTDTWAPNHEVTVRNQQDGMSRDIHGKYRFGAWHFRFDKKAYTNGTGFRLYLNGTAEHGEWRHLGTDGNQAISQDAVDFGGADPAERFRHGFDDFVLSRSARTDETVVPNTNEAILYDVIVVGSGMGGGIVADGLSNAGRKVLVLEAGGLELPTHMDNLPCDRNRTPLQYQSGIYENFGGSQAVRGVQFALGGRSLFWSGLIPRMYDFELHHFPDQVAGFFREGGYNEAEALLRKARVSGPDQAKLLEDFNGGISGFGFVAEDLPRSRDQVKLGPDGRFGDAVSEDTGVFSTADLLLGSLAVRGTSGSDNLTVNLHHLVLTVEKSGDGWRVNCMDLAGNRRRSYEGKVVVLAAGSIQSAKIALASGLGDPDFTGRGITDHPSYESMTYLVPEEHRLDNILRSYKFLARHKNISDATCPYHVEIGVNSFYWNVRFTDPKQLEEVLAMKKESEVKLQFTFGSHLNNDNRIEFRGNGSKVGLRMFQPEQTQAMAAEVRHHRNRLLEGLDLRELQPDRGMHYHKLGTPHHAGGSLRMGDAGNSVVDSDLRFHGHDNLFCCDPSVFPYIPIANPSLTLAALSLRLARRIASM